MSHVENVRGRRGRRMKIYEPGSGHAVLMYTSERFGSGSVICALYLYGVKRVRAHGPRRMPAACGRGWTGASADGIDFPTLVQRAGIAFASLTRFAEGVGRC